MQKYPGSFQDTLGNALSKASVTVYTDKAHTVKATVYSDNVGTVAPNPLTTDDLGEFSFYAADGRYYIGITKSGVVTQYLDDVVLFDPAASTGAAGVGFLQSGTGALTEPVSTTLKRLVFLSQFDTSGHYDTAKLALSASEKLAIGGALEFMSNVASVTKTVFRVPNINTDHADFALVVTSGVQGAFNSDTNWQLGYNPGHLRTGLPAINLSFESDFDNGSGPGVEWHLSAHSPAGTEWRPLSVRVENGSSFTALSANIDQLNFNDRTGVNQAMIWLPTDTTASLSLTSGTILRHNVNNVGWLYQDGGASSNIEMMRVDASRRVVINPAGTLAVVIGNGATFTLQDTGGGNAGMATTQIQTLDNGQLWLRSANGGTTYWKMVQGPLTAQANYRFAHGTSALGTTATDGFLFTQSCAGTPTGVPSSIPTGQIAMVYDTSANKIWFYNGSWRGVLVA